MDTNTGIIDYTGLNIQNYLSEKQRPGFLKNWELMTANYGNTADAQLLEKQVLICEETYSYLYCRTPQMPEYQRGLRPELERILSEIVAEQQDNESCVLAIVKYCSTLWRKRNGHILFYGGSEEDLCEKGEQLCECLSRLTVAFCTMLSIPARIITHVITGHLTCEVWINGKWCYVDPRKNLYFRKEDGLLASTWELWHDHSILRECEEEVRSCLSERFDKDITVQRLYSMYFNPDEVLTVKEYDFQNTAFYNYSWRTNYDLWAADINRTAIEYAKEKSVLFGIHEPQKPEILLSIEDNQMISNDMPIVAYVKNVVVPPERIVFYIDEKKVYTVSDVVPTGHIHNAVTASYYLSGDGETAEKLKLSGGKHVLTVEAWITPCQSISQKREFSVPDVAD